MVKFNRFLKRLYLKWFHAPLRQQETDWMDAWGSRLTTEFEILNRRDETIGYWAYGYCDPTSIFNQSDMDDPKIFNLFLKTNNQK